MNPAITGLTIRLQKGSDYWETSISVEDENGAPVPFLSTELTITPEGQTPIVWNPTNGYLTMPSSGHFAFDVPRTVIDGYNFEVASYKWSITYTNGKVDGQWMEGKVYIS